MPSLQSVPDVTFKTRVRDESVPGPNPFRWQDLTSAEIFRGQGVGVSPTRSFYIYVLIQSFATS